MGKDRSRKPPKPKRKQRPTQELDAELIELASVIAEHRLDNNVDGWFSLPWRSGWNPVRLCLAISDNLGVIDRYFNQAAREAYTLLRHWLEMRHSDDFRQFQALIYHQADDKRLALAGQQHVAPISTALRFVQVMIAKSDGGGHVYNDVLKLLFEYSPTMDPMQHVVDVLDARCRDAIGVGFQLQNDRHDRKRRAFLIAWQRGLYHAAYSIEPAVKEKG